MCWRLEPRPDISTDFNSLRQLPVVDPVASVVWNSLNEGLCGGRIALPSQSDTNNPLREREELCPRLAAAFSPVSP